MARSSGDASADGAEDAANPAGDADAAEETDARADRSDASSEASSDASSEASSDARGAADADAGAAEAGTDTRDAAGQLGTSRPNYAFVSSGAVRPQFSSLAAVDAFCTAQAMAARLPGKYVAWLSDASVDARDRLGAARGWVGTDGVPFADTVDDLVTGHILYPLHLDERSMPADPRQDATIVTGTSMGRFVAGASCADWTSTFLTDTAMGALVNAGGTAWDATITIGCRDQARVFCLGVDQAVAVKVPPPPKARLAFLTDRRWLPSSGISRADDLCQSEADKAQLTGSYKAVLATSQVDIFDRLGSEVFAGPWIRVDGVVLTRADRTNMGALLAAWHVSASGQYLSEELVAVGGEHLLDHPAPSMTCNDWSVGTGTTAASVPLLPDQWFLSHKTFECSQDSRLYCVDVTPRP